MGGLETTEMKVTEVEDNHLTVCSDDSLCFGFQWQDEWGSVPEIGTPFLIEGRFGGPVTGVYRADGEVLLDSEHFKKKNDDMLARWAQDRLDNLEKNRDIWKADIEALSPPFKARIERFIEQDGGFDALFGDMGDYELFILRQANALYDEYMTCGQPHYDFWDKDQKDKHAMDWFNGFKAMSLDQQKEVFAGLDEGHSGNTHDAMIALARAVALGNPI